MEIKGADIVFKRALDGYCRRKWNFPAVRKAVLEIYQEKGYPKPKIYICDSPDAVIKLGLELKYNEKLQEFQSRHNINDSIWTKVDKASNEIFGKEYLDSIWETEIRGIHGLDSNIFETIENRLARENFSTDKALSEKEYFFSLELGIWGDYFKRKGYLKELNKDVLAQITLCRESGWTCFFKEAIIVSKRPSILKYSLDGQSLHSEAKPALEYEDGFKFWAWNGFIVSKEVISSPKLFKAKARLAKANFDDCLVLAERKETPWEVLFQLVKSKIPAIDEIAILNPRFPLEKAENLLKSGELSKDAERGYRARIKEVIDL